ncbi:hypothetical protein BDZ45DRAFT_752471 [Acephala macrosclerotiorum]|nr:hypothetical protein BDZ45DRAFT_752471 [Acephala macrosclerotiorum]
MAGTSIDEVKMTRGMRDLILEMAASTNPVQDTSRDPPSPLFIASSYGGRSLDEGKVFGYHDPDQAVRQSLLDSGYIDESFHEGELFSQQDADRAVRERILELGHFDESYFQGELDGHLDSTSEDVSEDVDGMSWLVGMVSKENIPSRKWLERNEIGPQWIKAGILHPHFSPHVYGIQAILETPPTRKQKHEEDFLFPSLPVWEKLHYWDLNIEINESLIEEGIMDRRRLENNEPRRHQTGSYRCVPSPLRRVYTWRYPIE